MPAVSAGLASCLRALVRAIASAAMWWMMSNGGVKVGITFPSWSVEPGRMKRRSAARASSRSRMPCSM